MTPDKRELARRIAGRFGKEDAHAIIAHALLDAEAELAAAKAEVERLRTLVEYTYYEGWQYNEVNHFLDAKALWNISNAKKALEKTT